ncbi:competence protein CoiA family protein [Mycobacteroides abscessus]|uniref:competence protein CoiA family protein n=1 Tax=Mycobacteroides abscessus TaxID=36809 RepID=UPI001300166C|nr:hypothetical protein [Mycobacteroides abscessus]
MSTEFDSEDPDDADKWPNYCSNRRMTAANTVHGNLVWVRLPGIYAEWKGRKGLRCVACGWRAVPYRLGSGNIFVRHHAEENSQPMPDVAPEHLESYQHMLLKYWARDKLRELGATDVHVEKNQGARRPDVSGYFGGRLLAVEIQRSSVNLHEVHARNSQLKDQNCDTLWLAHHRDFLHRIPAIIIDSFEVLDGEYTYSMGLFSADKHNKTLQPDNSKRMLYQFFDSWANGSVIWSWIDTRQGGWADIPSWHAYRDHLIRTIDEQADEIKSNQQLGELYQGDIEDLQNEVQTLQNTIREYTTKLEDVNQRIAKKATQMDTMGEEIQQWRALAPKLRHQTAKAEERAKVAETRTAKIAIPLVLMILILTICLVKSCGSETVSHKGPRDRYSSSATTQTSP